MNTKHGFVGRVLVVTLAGVLAAGSQPAAFAEDEEGARPEKKLKSCYDDPAYKELDFWVGDWDVMLGDRKVGTNRIEKILRGCAVMEHWESESGGSGKSLFVYDPIAEIWKQTWVTDAAFSPGGLKEKVLVERLSDGALRFQGEIALQNGHLYLDRTTLTPRRDGTIRQIIEVSHDEGASWTTTFDAVYVRKARTTQ